MKRTFAFLILLIQFGAFKAFSQSDNYKKEAETGHSIKEIKGIQSLPKSLNFLIMGDWGRHGEPKQRSVADMMASAVVGQDAAFIITTGDNFYPSGVASEFDPSWQSSFENVYNQHPLFCEWWNVLGNHDYKTNPDAQIAYSKLSARWKMPARYYSITKKIDDKATVDFFFIDTSPFQKEYYKNEEYGPKVMLVDTLAQKKWLVQALSASKANWKVVVGHHPLYSAGKRKGKTLDMENSFANLFDQYGVDIYFCGHEHHLGHDQDKGRKFQQFISGAGSEATAVSSAPFSKFAVQDFGFMTASVTEKEMLIQVINDQGKILYTTSVKK